MDNLFTQELISEKEYDCAEQYNQNFDEFIGEFNDEFIIDEDLDKLNIERIEKAEN